MRHVSFAHLSAGSLGAVCGDLLLAAHVTLHCEVVAALPYAFVVRAGTVLVACHCCCERCYRMCELFLRTTLVVVLSD